METTPLPLSVGGGGGDGGEKPSPPPPLTHLLQHQKPYVSCIKVDGVPILPPIMTDSKREEMRGYRQLAIEREKEKELKRKESVLVPVFKMESVPGSSSRPSTTGTGSGSPFNAEREGLYITSTPKKDEGIAIAVAGREKEEEEGDIIDQIGDRLRIRLNFVDLAKEEETQSSGSSLASTATFTVRKGGKDSEEEVEELEQEEEQTESKMPVKTVIRKPTLASSQSSAPSSGRSEGSETQGQRQVSPYKRKRPAKYFDEGSSSSEVEEDVDVTVSTSTSLSKYMTPEGKGGREENKEEEEQNVPLPSPPPLSAISTQTTPTLMQDVINSDKSITDSPMPVTPTKKGTKVLAFGSPAASSAAQSPKPQPELSQVGLSKFQNKMQQINPGMLKNPGDMRSPLLKGLLFPDPLERSSATLKIPPEANDPSMKPKFDRLSAAVKGYLTRRLLQTERIQSIIQTIKDTVELLLNLYEEHPPNDQGLIEIQEADQGLHQRLVQQLTGACAGFHDIFFKISTKERMAIIATDREKIRAKALRNVLSRRSGIPLSPSKRSISSATLKSLERRQTLSLSPKKKDNQTRGRRKTVSKPWSSGLPPIVPQGSQSVRNKPLKSHITSPKRRRMTLWSGTVADEDNNNLAPISRTNRQSMARVTAAYTTTEFAPIHPRRPFTAMQTRNSSQPKTFQPVFYSARESNNNGGWSSETFFVPKNARQPRPSTSRTSSARTTTTVVNPRAPWK